MYGKVVGRRLVSPQASNACGQEVPGTDWKAIFSNVEDLLSLHRFVFSQFELAQRDWPLVDNVGLLFMKLAPRFQLYGQYVNNFKIAMDTLNACQVSRSYVAKDSLSPSCFA